MRFYDALANIESAVRELTDETLKKIAHELTENLRKNISVDWSERESVRASLRLMVRRILRKTNTRPTWLRRRWSWCCSRPRHWARAGRCEQAGSHTVDFMTADHLGNIPSQDGLLPSGHGFGLGFAVRTHAGVSAIPG